MKLKLGKKPARKGAISFKLGTFIDRSSMPKPPMVIGHEKIGMPWGVLGNEDYSNCVFAGAAHEHMVWTHEGGAPTACFTLDNVLSDYSAVTGFDRNKPDTDQGTDMEAAANYRRNTGIVDASGVRHKIDAYVAPMIGDPSDLALLAYLTGAVGVGLMLPNSAMDQFDAEEPWDFKASNRGMAGGHYVPCIGRNHLGNFIVITWGRIQAMTPAFYSRFSDEAAGYLSLEVLRDRVSPEGFDEATLRSHLSSLGKSNEGAKNA